MLMSRLGRLKVYFNITESPQKVRIAASCGAKSGQVESDRRLGTVVVFPKLKSGL